MVEPFTYLNDDEFENLSVLKGTLTQQERDIINSHAGLNQKILNKLTCHPGKLIYNA
jgi:hypothetical protein